MCMSGCDGSQGAWCSTAAGSLLPSLAGSGTMMPCSVRREEVISRRRSPPYMALGMYASFTAVMLTVCIVCTHCCHDTAFMLEFVYGVLLIRSCDGQVELSAQQAVTHRIAELERRVELQHQTRP